MRLGVLRPFPSRIGGDNNLVIVVVLNEFGSIEWIAQRGGIWGMPLNGYWILTAPELWKMGYRRCDS
jgi:hypothetical protein